MNVRAMVAVARVDHWFKNVFVLPGIFIAYWLNPGVFAWSDLGGLLAALTAICLVASSNYALNEVLDAAEDRLHPVKSARPVASGELTARTGLAVWGALGAAGLGLGWTINGAFFLTLAALWIMGLIYNVPPVRTKEVPYLDVLSEAVNNPLRMLLGWYATGVTGVPPSSLLLAYWMVGAYLMMAKRLAEYRRIGDAERAAAYRASFRRYDEPLMITLMVCYASGFMFFFGVVLVKNQAELLLAAPFLMIYLAYYMQLTLRADSVVQTPERLFEDRTLVLLTLLVCAALLVLAFTDIPGFDELLGLGVT